MTHRDSIADALPPQIDGFRMLRKIGQGGMSEIWLAEEPALRRQVAVKVMLAGALADEISRRRFENEARTIAGLEHPGIVRIYQVGRTAAGLPWYSMPYLPHGHLAQRDYSRDEAGARRVLDALLAALEYAHARGVIHRDVKAENVLFDDTDQPLLADFGIALRRGHGARVTGAGLAVGSTAYMPPEQARGQQVDGRADLYSVGVLGWEVLTGSLPYVAGDALSMALLHAQKPIPRLPFALRHWQKFFDRALAKQPQARFQNATQMRTALAEIRIPPGGLAGGGRRRRAAMWGVATALGLAAAAALWWWRPPTPERPQAPPHPPGEAVATAQGPGTANVAASADDPLSRPLPSQPGEWQIAAARRQLASGHLFAPPRDNVLESLQAAAAVRPPPADVAPLAAEARRRASVQLEQAVNDGDAAAARRMLPAMAALTRLAGAGADAARQQQQQRLTAALAARIDRASRGNDRSEARKWTLLGREAGLDANDLRPLQQQSARIVQAGDQLAGEFGGARVQQLGGRLVGIPARAVSRADYAAFVEDTARAPSACRLASAPSRPQARRSWTSPGFAQGQDDPVACVSWQDAAAYAQWLSHRTRQDYRLPTHAEAAALPAVGGERALAVWLYECGSDCNQRQSTGKSWRGAEGERALDNRRGYDDIGFLLVRDP